MALLPNSAVGLLQIALLLRQGIRGDVCDCLTSVPLRVFSTDGGAVTLPCANVLSHHPNCSSTTWLYNKDGNVSTEEVVAHGIKRRAERLSLLSNCSLHIDDITTDDAGLYTCRQYPNETKHGEDAVVLLSVLHISSNRTEIQEGSNETLSCHLNSYRNCEDFRHVHLSWVDEGGAELQNTTNQLISKESPCSIKLTMGLRDPNSTHTQRAWTCQMTAGDNYSISVPVNIARTPVVTRQLPPPLQFSTPPPETAGAALCVFSVEIPIRLFIFSLVLIVPGLIGVVYVVKRKQTCTGDVPAIELQVQS